MDEENNAKEMGLERREKLLDEGQLLEEDEELVKDERNEAPVLALGCEHSTLPTMTSCASAR